MTKVSVVLFYKRIFTVGRTTIATNILLVLISLYIVVTFFVSTVRKGFMSTS